MCRNIRTLHNFEPPATEEEIRAAALQYVRKVSGSQKPSKANEAVFARGVGEGGAAATSAPAEHEASRRLLERTAVLRTIGGQAPRVMTRSGVLPDAYARRR